MLSSNPYRPRRAVQPDCRQHGRRLSRRLSGRLGRRGLLILAIALTGGPLAYIVMPMPVAAQPATLQVSPTPTATVATPALVGGMVLAGDLLTDPVGVVSSSGELAAIGGLIGWPVSDHTPSTGFGYRSDPFTHQQRWHDGVDLGQPCGDPARASLAGTVDHAGWAGGYGNRVVLRHVDRDGHSFATTYNHLARIAVTIGQPVTQGQVVGRIGSTGRSTACHLHFEVILDGSYVDPMRFLTGDTGKAALSRRVGSFMPAGLPSPATSSPTPGASPSSDTASSPRPGSPSPSSSTPSTASQPPSTPVPATPAPSSPVPSTPVPSTPVPSTPVPSTPTASTPGQPTSELPSRPATPSGPATPKGAVTAGQTTSDPTR